MMQKKFSLNDYLVRLGFSLALVMITFNPIEPYSYYYWAIKPLIFEFSFTVFKGFFGVILLIGWSVFLRATVKSLGVFGMVLAIIFFVLLLWLIVDLGWFGTGNKSIVWLLLIGLSGVLSVGLSWSYIRRRITGQQDVDDSDT